MSEWLRLNRAIYLRPGCVNNIKYYTPISCSKIQYSGILRILFGPGPYVFVRCWNDEDRAGEQLHADDCYFSTHLKIQRIVFYMMFGIVTILGNGTTAGYLGRLITRHIVHTPTSIQGDWIQLDGKTLLTGESSIAKSNHTIPNFKSVDMATLIWSELYVGLTWHFNRRNFHRSHDDNLQLCISLMIPPPLNK